MKELYTVSFSNQQFNELIQGNVSVYATSAKHALKKVTAMVSVPKGAYFMAVKNVDKLLPLADKYVA